MVRPRTRSSVASSGGEKHDGKLVSGGPEPLADLEAVQIGQHHVEDGQVDALFAGDREPVAPAVGLDDRVIGEADARR